MTMFNKNIIKPAWKFSQKGNLWRIFVTGSKILIGETRDLQEKKVYFFSIDINNGRTNLNNYLFENGNYWVSIEGYNSEQIFLHRFENPNLPDHKCIIAIDNISGKVLWENKELIYLFNTDDEIYAYKEKFESIEYFLINGKDGTIIKQIPVSEHEDVIKIKDKVTDRLYLDNNYTLIYNKDDVPENISEIIEKETGNKDIPGSIEYIIEESYLIFSYYSRKEIKHGKPDGYLFNNYLNIFEIPTNKKHYEDILNQDSKYNVPDCFFINGKYLFYLKNKKEIFAIKLIN
jgi:hypothetical protein